MNDEIIVSPKIDMGAVALPQSVEELRAKIAERRAEAELAGRRYRPTREILEGQKKFGYFPDGKPAGNGAKAGGAPGSPPAPAPAVLSEIAVKQFVSLPFYCWGLIHPYPFIALDENEQSALAQSAAPVLNEYAGQNPKAFGLISLSVTFTALVAARIILIGKVRQEERQAALLQEQKRQEAAARENGGK